MISRRPGPRLNRGRIATTGGSAYSFATDPQVMGYYRASSGLTDISGANVYGPLVATGGAVATAIDADGATVWQQRTASGGYLATAALGASIQNPCTVYMIAKAGPTPAANQNWFHNGFGSINYSTAAVMRFTQTTSVNMACTPANKNLFAVYLHSALTQYSVNGAAPSARAGGPNNGLNNGITLGATNAGGNRADVDIAEIIIVEGNPSAAFIASLTAYARANHASIGIPATPPAQFDPAQTSLGGLFSAPFDFIVLLGQSNNMGGLVQTGVLTPGGALAYVLANDNTIKACPLKYDDNTNYTETIITGTVQLGGNGTALAAAYTASSGRPLVLLPCAVGNSVICPTPTYAIKSWLQSAGRGNKQRNCLYGRALERAKNMIALGGTFRFITWYQGESDLGTDVSTYAAKLDSMLNQFCADLGVARRVYLQPVANYGLTADVLALQAQQASLASSNTLIGTPSSGPYEVDGVHLQAVPQNTIGAAIAAAAIGQGSPWI